MKFTFSIFLFLFVLSSCATQNRKRGVDLSGVESESENVALEEEAPKEGTQDRAPKGEIELGLSGESAEQVVIENGDEEVPAKVEVATEDAPTEEKKKSDKDKESEVDCEKKPEHEFCVQKAKQAAEKAKLAAEKNEGELILDSPEE